MSTLADINKVIRLVERAQSQADNATHFAQLAESNAIEASANLEAARAKLHALAAEVYEAKQVTP